MQEKKSSKGNLEKRRNTFLIIGFVIVFLLVYVCFELFAPSKKPIDLGPLEPVEIIITEEAPATDKTPPPPPPEQPQKDYILELVDKEIKLNLDSILFNPEYNEGDAIPPYEPIDIVDIEPELPPPTKIPEKNPEPIGGYEAMYAYLKSNLKYPERPRTNNIQGQIFVEFVVEKDGTISHVKILAGVDPELDQEAMRVVKLMPKWKPGEQLGKPVRCLFNIPIKFTIN